MKKRIIALVLSAVMLLGETLPVMAQNDTIDAYEEEAEEIAIEEDEAEEAEVVAEEAADDVVVEDTVSASEDDAATAVDGFVLPEELQGLECFSSDVEYDEEAGIAKVTLTAKLEPAENAEAAGEYYQLGGASTLNVAGGSFEANGKNYDLNTSVKYYSIINYRGRKIKAEEDLKATVVSTGLDQLASDLTVTGPYNIDVIKFKYSMKKNKNAGVASFTVKASVNKKIAKQLGIAGKSLKALKKAAKQFNKAAKAAPASFTINPAYLTIMHAYDDVYVQITLWYNMFTKAFVKWSNFAYRVRLDENAPSDKKKWPKLPAKDFKKKIKKVTNGCNVTITPKNKNFVGDPYTYELR